MEIGFKVGDYVRVRDWDDMAEEFGFDEDYDTYIDTPGFPYAESMEYLCGMEFEISYIDVEDGHGVGRVYGLKAAEDGDWCLSPAMLRLINDNFEGFDTSDMDKFLEMFPVKSS